MPTTAAKSYLIHTPQHPRPYITSVPFVARDFTEWGYRVDHHVSVSAYIREIRAREKEEAGKVMRGDGQQRRWGKIMEIWGREVVERKRVGGGVRVETVRGFEGVSDRIQKAGDFVQDFVGGLVAVGQCGCGVPRFSLLLLPDDDDDDDDENENQTKNRFSHFKRYAAPPPAPSQCPAKLITKYMHILYCIGYTPNAVLPPWSNPSIAVADQVVLEFLPHEAVRLEHLVHALESAIGKQEGRMGRVERDPANGVKRVLLWVDAGECVGNDGVGEDIGDPVPRYERGEGMPPEYVAGDGMGDG
ncbi:hypothetical protein BDW02DRAFT_572378 [Decorospora gaudefroyi]|uniref:Uncharacterized protein n=1 Tax=Decorospora gaudefroyi TaxID=184978 RepID=A0A6A5K814_9PLEO|nr:hypothetical protein BDW02DRAFT_572378 [Decorospora gaudefroyi]